MIEMIGTGDVMRMSVETDNIKHRTVYRKKISIKTETVAAFVTLLVIFLAYCSLNNDSFDLELLIVGVVLAFLYSKSIMDSILPSILLVVVTLIIFMFSGQTAERGFNAPILHMLKFVYFFLVMVLANIFPKLKQKHKKWSFAVLLITLTISLIISIYYTTVNIYAIRYSVDQGFTQVISFTQLYSLPILFSILICFFIVARENLGMKGKLLYIGLMVLIAVCVFLSLVTFAILLTIFGAVVAFFMYWEKTSKIKLFVIILFTVIMLLLVFVFAEPVSDFIYDFTSDWNWLVRGRIMSVVDSLLGTEHKNWYTHDRRDQLAGYSIAAFKENPFFGVGYSGYGYGVIGCHQEWSDLLGVFGLFGTIMIIIVFIYSSYRIYKHTRTKLDKMCYLTALTLLFVLGFLNPCLSLPVLVTVYVIAPNMSVLMPETRGAR